jgi:hypothetical protein
LRKHERSHVGVGVGELAEDEYTPEGQSNNNRPSPIQSSFRNSINDQYGDDNSGAYQNNENYQEPNQYDQNGAYQYEDEVNYQKQVQYQPGFTDSYYRSGQYQVDEQEGDAGFLMGLSGIQNHDPNQQIQVPEKEY